MTFSFKEFSFVIIGIFLLAACASSKPREHYVEVNDEDPKSFCSKAQSRFAIHPDEGRFESFRGEVKKGETFEKKISGNMLFKLFSKEKGWEIQILSSKIDTGDYSLVATPPYTMANDRVISTDDMSAKAATEKGLRGFCFVLNPDDFSKAKAASETIRKPYLSGDTIETQDAAYQKAVADLGAMNYGVGFLTITDSEIKTGDVEEISRLVFDVEIRRP